MISNISGNKYVKVKDIHKVFGQGEYVVGIDMDSGEYYFWGECVHVNIKGKKPHYIDGGFRTCFDAYSRLYANNKVVLENGYMTNIDNIVISKEIGLYQGICIELGEKFHKGDIVMHMKKDMITMK